MHMSPLRYIYQYEIAAIFLCVIIILILIRRRCLKNHRNILFLFLVLSELFSAGLDVAANIMINTIEMGGSVNVQALALVQGTFLFAHNLMPLMFFYYVLALIGKTRSKGFYIAIFVPCLVVLMLVATNWLTNWVFYFDDAQSYTHGWAIYVLYAIAFSYMIAASIYALIYRKAMPKGYSQLTVLFIAVAAIATIIQFFFESLMIEIFVCTVVLLLMAVNFETEESRRDPTTRLYNRAAFLTEAERAFYSGEKREILIIKLGDIHRLNMINGAKNIDAILRQVGDFFLHLSAESNCYDCGEGNMAIPFKSVEKLEIAFSLIKDRLSRVFGNEITEVLFEPLYIRINMPKEAKTLQELVLLLDSPYTQAGEEGVEALNRLLREVEVEAAIERAIEEDSVLVYYQPIYSRNKKRINSAEALCRINDSKLGFLSPAEFIPIAEKSGKIGQLGLQIFRKVALLQSKVDFTSLGLDYIEVNLSALQVLDPNLYANFSEIAKRYNMPSSFINFEITESAFIENMDAVVKTMQRFIQDGFSFSIDDFGTGYSNFSYLYDMQFHIVKIDKSILDKTSESSVALSTLVSMIGMLKNLSLEVLQEGVESLEQEQMLLENGIDYVQGYYHSMPIPEDEFIDFLMKHNATEAALA